ncbi:Rpn family recombination-promoting nuclease/putative transposase [Nocardia sp. NPDC058705]|uniref:Rpn family recombination-promoting nuclease/putative transposase n=1 Tax=Nocardia sp. NPDC058705 TaxID=3346609 RepID=UPI00369A3256
MVEQPSNPHDAFTRHILGRTANAASELRSVLPEHLVQQVNWKTLRLLPGSFVSPQLRSRYTDLPFSAEINGEQAIIYFLIEHQSSNDHPMALRLTEYMVNIWTQYVDTHPNTKTLPIVIPVVLHTSPRGYRWTAPTDLSQLFALSAPLRESLGDLVPHMRFILDDIARTDLAELQKRPLTPAVRVMLFVQQHALGRKDLGVTMMPLVADLSAMAEAPGGDSDLQAVVTYIMTVGETAPADFDPLIRRLDPHAKEVIMTTGEMLRAEGVAKGRAEGEADLLIRLLGRKFGDVPESIIRRVRSADPSDLHRWADQILTASSFEETLS